MTPDHHPDEFMNGDTPMVHVRVLIHWRDGYDLGITEHRAIAMHNDDGHYELCEYWWSEGNGGCDCNRRAFIGRCGDDGESPCGNEISIRALESLDPRIPSLDLDEV